MLNLTFHGMAYKLTGDQTERVFDNLRFLQDTILHLEDDSVKKEAKAAQREKELMENNAGEESDRLYLQEQNKHLEHIAKNLEYRLEEKAKRELVLEMELERVKKLLNEMILKSNKSEDAVAAGTTHSTPAANFKIVDSSTQAKTGNIATGGDQALSSTSTTSVNRDVTVMASYRLKMPMYKTGNDIETFVNRFEQFCQAQTVLPAQKANLILNALDDTTFTVVTRELTETERNNYNTVKEHLLTRFDILKEKGQRRLLLRQARRKPGQDLQSFYTEILTLAAKAYPGPHTAEQALITDEAIMDQLICGCEDEKMRLFLLDKSPKSSREALSLATSYQSALRYNDTIRNINTAHTDVDAVATNSSAAGRSSYRDERNNYRTWNNDARILRSQPYQYYKEKFNNIGRGYEQIHNDFNQRRDYFGETRGIGRSMNRGHFFNQAMNGRGNINRNWRQRSNSIDRYIPYNRPGTPTISPRRNLEWNNLIIGNQLVESRTHDNSTENGEHIQAVNNAEEYDRNTSTHNQQNPAYFLAGKLGDGEVFMLCDTGSSVSLIDDSVWENIKNKMGKLTEVNYSVRSASKHSLDILGETKLTFSLLTKKGSWKNYEFQFMVVRGLSKPVILGMNFFYANKALIDVYNKRVFLYEGNTKTTYQLEGRTYCTSTVDYICPCITSEKFKPPKENTRAELQPIKTTAVFELLELYFIGPLPETTNGNKYILSVVDNFSKYAAAYATSRQDSKTVIDCLTKLFSEFGVPSKIFSDQGRSFVSKEFQDFLKLWNVKKATATSYHSQTSGLVERFNGTVIRILKRYVYETQDKWDASLPYATYAYNTTVQRTNEFSPYEIIFGKKASNLFLEQLENKSENDTVNDYIAQTKRQIQKICDIVIQNQEKTRDAAKSKYDETARGSCFKAGDRVLLFNPAFKLGQNKKFTPAYVGPFTITEQQMETNFKILPDNPKEKTQIVHQNRLKCFRGYRIHQQNTIPAAVEDSTVDNNPTNLSDIDSASEDDDENEILKIHLTKEEDIKVTKQTTFGNIIARNDSSRDPEQIEPNNTNQHDIINRLIVRENERHNGSEAEVRTENDAKENENTPNKGKEDTSNNHTSISDRYDTTNASQDDSTYRLQRSITPSLPRRSPERNRRPPVRFSSADTYINLITVEDKKPINAKTQRNQTKSFSKWHIFSILIWSLLLRVGDTARWDIVTDSPATNFSTEQNETSAMFNSSENMANYFGKAHICGTRSKHASYIALPNMPDCKMKGDQDTGKIERVLVTPYFVPVFSDPVEAYACEVEKANLTTFLGFFGTKSILDQSLDYQPLDLELCRKEVKAIQEKNTHLTEIGHDIWSNSAITWDPQYKWCCKNVIHIRYRIRVCKITTRFNFHNHHVVSTTYPIEKCNIDRDHCILKMATIARSPAYHECDVHAGKKVFAERKWNNNMDSFDLVSEEGQLAVTGTHKTENHCEMELCPTNEGMYLKFGNAKLRPWSDSENMKEIKTTNKHALLYFVTKYMEKFSTNLFVRNWISICEIQRQRYQMLRHFMANQNIAYLAARMLLQTPNVFAYPAGQLLQVHECTLIDEYYWEPDTSYYNTIPIHFNGKHKGFLVHETNDIKLMNSACTCEDAMQRYMKTEDDKWYVRTGNKLETTHIYYHTIEMIRQMPEIRSLQLLPSYVDNPTADVIDLLSDMSTSITNNVLTLLRATGTDAVAFDPAIVRNAAVKTVAMMETTVHAILKSISPFWRWLNIIILSAVGILVIGIVLFILVRVKNEMDKCKTDGMIEDMLKLTKERHARILNIVENLSEKLLKDDDDLSLPPPPNMDEMNMV